MDINNLLKERGDPIYAESDWNALVRLIRRAINFDVGSGLDLKKTANGMFLALVEDHSSWWGIIKSAGPSSESDYTDERYWVARAFCNNTDSSETSVATLTNYPTDSVRKRWITATNFAETITGTHALVVDTPVQIYELHDNGSPYKIRYVFNAGGAGGESPCPYKDQVKIANAQNVVPTCGFVKAHAPVL